MQVFDQIAQKFQEAQSNPAATLDSKVYEGLLIFYFIST